MSASLTEGETRCSCVLYRWQTGWRLWRRPAWASTPSTITHQLCCPHQLHLSVPWVPHPDNRVCAPASHRLPVRTTLGVQSAWINATPLSGAARGTLTERLLLDMCLVISCLFMFYHSFNKYRLTLYSTGYRTRMVSLTMKPTTGYLCPKYSCFPGTQR